MFVVAGVSGKVGSVVASTLIDRTVKDGTPRVRVMVRDAIKGERFRAAGAEAGCGTDAAADGTVGGFVAEAALAGLDAAAGGESCDGACGAINISHGDARISV